MEKMNLEIIERGELCELKKNGKSQADDCEKLMYLAMAEGKNQPTQIYIKSEEGHIRKTILVPDAFYEDELRKRDELIGLFDKFLSDFIGLPDDIGEHYTEPIDEVYDFLIQMLELSGWGLLPNQALMKIERGNEIQKRDNIIHLTADLLQYNNLASPAILADFYNFPDKISIDRLINKVEQLLKESKDEQDSFMIYIMEQPLENNHSSSGLLPVFVEENGSLRIVAWIAQEVIPNNLVPVFDFEQKLVGWLDQNIDQHGDMQI
jgi:hypothetical protein